MYLAGTSTPSQVSWIGSVQVFLLFALSLPAGKLFDDGYFHPMMISASVLYVFRCRVPPFPLSVSVPVSVPADALN